MPLLSITHLQTIWSFFDIQGAEKTSYENSLVLTNFNHSIIVIGNNILCVHILYIRCEGEASYNYFYASVGHLPDDGQKTGQNKL
jgi:hypothetical protein